MTDRPTLAGPDQHAQQGQQGQHGQLLQLLRLLRDGTARTRAELASSLGLSRSTTGLRLDTLTDLGLLAAGGDAGSTGGRPAALIALRPDARLVVAADLGAGHARVAVTDLLGRVLAADESPERIDAGPEAVLGRLADTTERLVAGLGRVPSDVAAVGVGLPGPVQHATGRPWNPPIMPGWHDVDVPALVRRRLDAPVLVDNDVNIMALGEQATAFPDVDDLLFVKVATGIGSGIISDGVLRRGAQGVAGDIGHVRVARGAGIPCTCGNDGCLEALASRPAITAALAAAGQEAQDADDVARLLAAGQPDAVAVVRQAGRDLGEVLAGCVNVLNPSVIVIGGSLAVAGEQLLAGVREVVYSRSTPAATERLTVTLSQSREQAAVLGAAILALDHLFGPDGVDALVG